jgi:adenylate kinase
MAKTPLCLVLLGGPGSGKGTHGRAIAKALKLTHISTGEKFREHMEAGTPLGVLARSHIDHGELVPDDVTAKFLRQILGELGPGEGFVLDGYPRTLPQGRDLQTILWDAGRRLTVVIALNVSDKEMLRRLSGRLTCRRCHATFHQENTPPPEPGRCPACNGELYQRDDDNPETIRKRIKIYQERTRPLADFFRSQGLYREVDAEGPKEEVSGRVLSALREMAAVDGLRAESGLG